MILETLTPALITAAATLVAAILGAAATVASQRSKSSISVKGSREPPPSLQNPGSKPALLSGDGRAVRVTCVKAYVDPPTGIIVAIDYQYVSRLTYHLHIRLTRPDGTVVNAENAKIGDRIDFEAHRRRYALILEQKDPDHWWANFHIREVDSG